MTAEAIDVVVWHRHPFVCDALVEVIAAQPYVTRATPAPTVECLTDSCSEQGPTTCLVDLDEPAGAQWGAIEVLARRPAVRVVGLTAALDPDLARRAWETGVRAVVEAGKGLDGVLAELHPEGWRSTAIRARELGGTRRRELDDLERDVLAMIAAGRTARTIVEELGVTAAKVDAAKRSAFAKLGVQQQAHAVAVALREGLLEPSSVADPAR